LETNTSRTLKFPSLDLNARQRSRTLTEVNEWKPCERPRRRREQPASVVYNLLFYFFFRWLDRDDHKISVEIFLVAEGKGPTLERFPPKSRLGGVALNVE
jgi:hypothetical protein